MTKAKKSFSNLGQQAVNKFFSNPISNEQDETINNNLDLSDNKILNNTQNTLNTPNELIAPNAPITQNYGVKDNALSAIMDREKESLTHQSISVNNEELKVKTRVQKKPRINIAFDDDLLEYLQLMSRLDGCSITQYTNNLIRENMNMRAEEYSTAIKLLKKK